MPYANPASHTMSRPREAVYQPSQPQNVQTKRSCLMWEGAETATVTEGPITDSNRDTRHRQRQRHLSQRVTEGPVTDSDRGTRHRQRQRHLSQKATEAPISINVLATHIHRTPVLLTVCTSMGKLAQTDRKRT